MSPWLMMHTEAVQVEYIITIKHYIRQNFESYSKSKAKRSYPQFDCLLRVEALHWIQSLLGSFCESVDLDQSLSHARLTRHEDRINELVRCVYCS